jgi:insulysin
MKNGMPVTLISDPTTTKAGAAINVFAGSSTEPLEGVAHFLEHLVFMGTKKYPEDNEFMTYVQNHGGVVNAYTSPFNTAYHYDIDDEDQLEFTLDMLTNFFIEPLLTQDSIDREVYAVNNEYEIHIHNPMLKMSSVLKNLGNPNNEQSKFYIGNLETLRDAPERDGVDVREALVGFFEENYSSDMMSAAIFANLPLN